MKPSQALNLSAKVLLSLTLLFVCPLFLQAQSKEKKSNPPPPPPPQKQQSQPQQPRPQQQQQQRPANTQQNGGNAGRGATGAASSGNAGRGATGAANRGNAGRGASRPANRGHAGRGATGAANGGNAGRGATGAANSGNAGRGATGAANSGNAGRGATGAANSGNAGRGATGAAKAGNGGPRSVPPNLQAARDANGRSTFKDKATGRQWETNTKGEVTHFSEPGREVKFSAAGKPTFIRDEKRGITIDHSQHGERHIITEHRDANNRLESRVVTAGPNRSFVEHRFERGGSEYVRRTYVYEGRTNVTVYRTYYYNNVAYYHYVPAYYYAPVYYGWAYNPWPAPVYYTWGWYGDPWYRPYGYYFSPYPVYPSAAFWLTDYLIAENLQAAYRAQADANANAAAANADEAAANANAAAAAAQRGAQSGAVTLTPEVKQMIAEEVKAQLAAEQASAAQNGAASGTPTSVPAQPAGNPEQVPPALDPNLRVFIVTASLDVTANGQPCSLSPGDVLRRMDNAPDSDNTVGVMVLSSKKSDCGMDSSPRLQVADLQEMHNHFREQLDNGLKTLADNKGKKGIPSGPAAGGRKNADGTAAPDLTAATDLQKQKQDADQTEKEVQQAASSTSGTGGNN